MSVKAEMSVKQEAETEGPGPRAKRSSTHTFQSKIGIFVVKKKKIKKKMSGMQDAEQ